MDIHLPEATAAVVGATGAIGSVAAEMLARDVAKLWLIGRRTTALEKVRDRIRERATARIEISTAMSDLASADVILTVTSAVDTLIEPQHLKPGAVVCDVARPRDVSAQVAAVRDDVLVIDGGMVAVPGLVDFHFNFGFPPGMAYACMAETMALALDGTLESYTLGKHITLEQVERIEQIAKKHGFKLGGFRSFERAITPEQLERIRTRAQANRRQAQV
jgi:predicted amino acid dehydrogenase